MTSEDRIWEDLQSRWAIGDSLSEAEDAMRLDLAAREPRRKREVDVAEQLHLYLADGEGEPLAPSFVESVLQGAGERRPPHLRLVAPSDVGVSDLDENNLRTPRWRAGRTLAGAGVALTLAAGAVVVLQHSTERDEAALAAHRSVERVESQSITLARSELVFASGSVALNGKPVKLGQRTLSAGEQLSTETGQACFTVEPRIDVCLGAKSSVVLESLDERDVRVKVLAGQVVAALQKRLPGHQFALTDGEVTATARGTVFALTRDASQVETRVTVVEGRVEVSTENAAPSMVQAHTEYALAQNAPAKRSSVSRNHEAQFLSLVAPRELWQEGELGIIEIGRGPAGAQVSIGGEGPFDLPLRTFSPAGQQRVVVRDAQGAESLLDVEVRAGETEHVELAAESTGEQAGLPAGRVQPKSARELLGDARAAMSRRDSAGALAAYRRLMALHPGSPEASTVLVTVGKLELRQNSPSRALRAFDAYLKRGGPLQPEALAGKIRALRALGQRAAERQAIRHYLRVYPDGFEAVALKKRLEVL